MKEINKSCYGKYISLLNNEGIDIGYLFEILLNFKLDFNSVTHDSDKDEKELIRLIKQYQSDSI